LILRTFWYTNLIETFPVYRQRQHRFPRKKRSCGVSYPVPLRDGVPDFVILKKQRQAMPLYAILGRMHKEGHNVEQSTTLQ